MAKFVNIIRRILKFFQRPIHTSVEIKISDCNYLLRGKNILITGGTKGIGKSMAIEFVKAGADVMITGRNEHEVKEIANEIGCKGLELNLQEVEKFDQLIGIVIKEFGKIDCLVNNAGISLHEKSIFEVTLENWDRQFNTNLKGPFFLTQKYIKYLLDNNRSGNILFISSETGETVDNRPYGFTKAAVNSMVQGLANLYKLKGIRINAIAPGITASDMTGVRSDGNLYAGEYGQGRFYLPEEIAEVATFLLSDVSNCISGQIITCNNSQTVNARWKK